MKPIRLLTAHPRSIYRLPSTATRPIHSTSTNSAFPVAHATAPAPPPPAPTVPTSERDERIARKKKQAALLEAARNIRAESKKPSGPLQKRFWKEVLVKRTDEGYQIYLDARPVRNTNKQIINIPLSKLPLATALAIEWDMLVSVQQALKQHYIPLTSLVSRALDIQSADAAGNTEVRSSLIRVLMRYLATDTLLCWAPAKEVVEEGREGLRSVQMRTAKPILAWLTSRVWSGVEVVPTLAEDSILPVEQPQETRDVIAGWLYGVPAFELAGIERAVLATKSLCTAVRFVAEWSEDLGVPREQSGEQVFGVLEAAEAATVEVAWQTGQWGEVEDTHDVEREDLRRQLGSVVLLVSGSKGRS